MALPQLVASNALAQVFGQSVHTGSTILARVGKTFVNFNAVCHHRIGVEDFCVASVTFTDVYARSIVLAGRMGWTHVFHSGAWGHFVGTVGSRPSRWAVACVICCQVDAVRPVLAWRGKTLVVVSFTSGTVKSGSAVAEEPVQYIGAEPPCIARL